MMQKTENVTSIPLSKTLAVLIGFPIISTLISLLFLNRPLIINLGLDVLNKPVWIIITVWYLIQIYIVSKILHSAGWKWGDIGFMLSKKKTFYFIGGYFLVAFGLLAFIELALANSIVDIEKMNQISSLTPKTTTARILFIFMGLTAGLAEEIVYRGFAISALLGNKLNKWLSVFVATIPFIFQHGLKSIDQFWWYLTWGVVLGILYLWLKKLTINIIIHWIVILSAMIAILQVIP